MSAEPRNTINAATGGGYRIATDSSSGKLRLKSNDDAIGTGIRSTIMIAAIHTTSASP